MPVQLELEDHMELWNHVQVELIDMRLCSTGVSIDFCMPSSGFICAAAHIPYIEFGGVRYSETSDLILHGGPGTRVQLSPRFGQGEFYMLLYQYTWPPHTSAEMMQLAHSCQFGQEVSAVRTDAHSAISEYLHAIVSSWQKKQAGAALQCKAQFLSFLYEWVQLRHQQTAQPDIDPITQLIAYMHENYAQPLSLAQLAELANYSIAHLCALFKETTGYAPIDYLTRLRVEQAKSLLRESALTLPAVAEQVGYRDPYYFGRLFKRLTGLSPMQYKRMTRQDKAEPPSSLSLLPASPPLLLSPYMFKRAERRIIEHAIGEAELSGIPQRIVALDWTTAEFLLALGIVPIGVSELGGLHRWVNLPVTIPRSVIDVGERVLPDLDKIAALSPDLIIGTRMLVSPHYQGLQQIAPTIVYELFPASLHTSEFQAMEQAFSHLADVLDRKSLANAVRCKLDGSLGDMRDYLRALRLSSNKAVLAFGYSRSEHSLMRIAHDLSLSVDALERLGLSNGFLPGHYQQAGFSTLSIDEMIVDESAQLLYVVQHDDQTAVRRLQQENSWKMLNTRSGNKRKPAGSSGMIWPYGGPISVHMMSTAITQSLSLLRS